jgi:hypothetical protein
MVVGIAGEVCRTLACFQRVSVCFGRSSCKSSVKVLVCLASLFHIVGVVCLSPAKVPPHPTFSFFFFFFSAVVVPARLVG